MQNRMRIVRTLNFLKGLLKRILDFQTYYKIYGCIYLHNIKMCKVFLNNILPFIFGYLFMRFYNYSVFIRNLDLTESKFLRMEFNNHE